MGVGEIYAVKSCQVLSQVQVHVLKVADGCRRDAVKSCQVSSQVHVHVMKVAGGVGEMRSSPARCVCTC